MAISISSLAIAAAHWTNSKLLFHCYFKFLSQRRMMEDGLGEGVKNITTPLSPPLDFICLTTFNHLHFAAAEHSVQLFSTECCWSSTPWTSQLFCAVHQLWSAPPVIGLKYKAMVHLYKAFTCSRSSLWTDLILDLRRAIFLDMKVLSQNIFRSWIRLPFSCVIQKCHSSNTLFMVSIYKRQKVSEHSLLTPPKIDLAVVLLLQTTVKQYLPNGSLNTSSCSLLQFRCLKRSRLPCVTNSWSSGVRWFPLAS